MVHFVGSVARGLVAVACLGAVATLGCGEGAGDSASASNPASDVAAAAEGDAAEATDGVVAGAADVAPTLQIGTQEFGKTTPSAFVPLQDGDDLRVVLGFQGSYMVVVAFRTRGIPQAATGVTFAVRLEAAGDVRAKLAYNKPKTLLDGGDGFAYFYNVPLVTEDWEAYADAEGTLTVDLADPDGTPLATAAVQIVVRPPDDS